jgi:micrococcal nuclease
MPQGRGNAVGVGWLVTGAVLVAIVAIVAAFAFRTAAPEVYPIGTSPTKVPSATAAGSPGTYLAASVTEVVDGDTLHVSIAGGADKVRVIGIDTPETNKPATPLECFALAATAAAEALLPQGSEIRLQLDPTQAKRDRFDRLLAHVFLADGRLFAEVMIEAGFGIHYVYGGVPSIYATRLAAAQERARTSGAGLWAAGTCHGDPHLPAP